MDNLAEENKRLKKEVAEMKLAFNLIEERIDKWNIDSDKPKEETRDTRYDALLNELRMNDNLLNGEHQSKEKPKAVERAESKYKALLDELEVGEYKLNK